MSDLESLACGVAAGVAILVGVLLSLMTLAIAAAF